MFDSARERLHYTLVLFPEARGFLDAVGDAQDGPHLAAFLKTYSSDLGSIAQSIIPLLREWRLSLTQHEAEPLSNTAQKEQLLQSIAQRLQAQRTPVEYAELGVKLAWALSFLPEPLKHQLRRATTGEKRRFFPSLSAPLLSHLQVLDIPLVSDPYPPGASFIFAFSHPDLVPSPTIPMPILSDMGRQKWLCSLTGPYS